MTEEGHFSARIGKGVTGQMLTFLPNPTFFFFFSVHDILMSFEEESRFEQLICKRQR